MRRVLAIPEMVLPAAALTRSDYSVVRLDVIAIKRNAKCAIFRRAAANGLGVITYLGRQEEKLWECLRPSCGSYAR